MATESWLWQLPPAGDEQGLEGYAVVDVYGRPAGRLRVLVDRGGDLYTVVRAGSPLRATNRAVPLEDVAFADHARCLVGLAITREQLRQCRLLAPRHAVTHAPADAVRVTAVPPLPTVGRTPAHAATSPFAPTLFLSSAGLLALLAMILFVTAPWDTWEFGLFGIPAALFLLALAEAYRGAFGRQGHVEAEVGWTGPSVIAGRSRVCPASPRQRSRSSARR